MSVSSLLFSHSRRLLAPAATVITHRFRVLPTRPAAVALQARYYTKKKGGGGRNKRESTIDDLLDELDSDDEEMEEASKITRPNLERLEEDVLHNSPVAKFIQEAQQHHKAKHKKSDSRGKAKGKSAHIAFVDYVDVKEEVDVDSYWAEMEKEVEDMKQFFIHNLTLRSGTALDELPVSLEGDVYPLQEVASISKRDPKRIVIDSTSFPQATKDIMDAIRNAGMNLNPQQEGTRIYVPLPKVTKEHRERLSKGAKTKLNETKDKLRRIQNKYISKLGDKQLQGGDPKDRILATKGVLLAVCEHFAKEAEQITLTKQKELMGGI